MRYQEFTPHPLLAPFVRLIWTLELDDPGDFGPAERIVPDGVVELVFHAATPFAMRFARADVARQPRSFALLQTRRFVEIAPAGPSSFVSVRFHPWGAHHFFRPPLSELADRMVGVSDLLGREAAQVEERVASAPDASARVAAVEAFLTAQLRRSHRPGVDGLAKAVWERKGDVKLKHLCGELGVSQRRLERTFQAELGVSPKHFARLSRFLHACTLLRRGGYASLTDTGAACGYYDQAHFIVEFKSFSGMTPGRFAAGRDVAFVDLE